MIFVKKKYSKLFVSIGLITTILFSGQNISLAEDQFTNDLVPTMTSNTSPSPLVINASSQDHELRPPYKVFDDQTKFGSTTYWANGPMGTGGAGWISVDFGENNEKRVQAYTITAFGHTTAPKAWTIEGSNNDTDWVILDTQTDVVFASSQKKSFAFSNSSSYRYYRLNVTSSRENNSLDIQEIELLDKIENTPDPDPDPEPTPTGDNALLVIKMISGLEKEYELTASEVQDFIDWYNGRADGRGKETYMFDKDFNKGPFTARKDYVAFSKIQSFEVMEYSK
ncbi:MULTISPECIES: discoidin domain-containing protein [Brevibacillus]|uniref:discoidin domain-containing protein n=1 Tax=Brevibacillus TaxID=55080 RepID=UPI001E59B55A|nr:MULTISPECIES: discoidin domain-containing protein [Brevibacillus]MCE0453763.1 discoidin domain-containing protein [Brevibacillus sp. AF8]UKK97759.1 discoidin domain-containing protein [Brevibacillus brevis]